MIWVQKLISASEEGEWWGVLESVIHTDTIRVYNVLMSVMVLILWRLIVFIKRLVDFISCRLPSCICIRNFLHKHNGLLSFKKKKTIVFFSPFFCFARKGGHLSWRLCCREDSLIEREIFWLRFWFNSIILKMFWLLIR